MEEGQDTREKKLALELADALGDRTGFGYYLTIAQRYRESHVRKVLEHVLSIPPHRIRTTRGALFNWLITNFDEDQFNN